MKMEKVRGWINKNPFDFVIWFACCFFVAIFIYPLIGDKVTPGWDLTSHFYLVKLMAEFLSEGSLTGYDGNWFGGYPAFTFYGPFAYFIVALVHLLSFKLIPLFLIFNILLFLIPFFFLGAVYFTSRVWFGKKSGAFSLIFAFIFLMADKEYAHFGIGIGSEIFVGLFTNLLAISFMVLLFGVLGKIVKERQKNKSLIVVGAIIFSLIILTHTLTSVFTAILLLLLFLFFPKYWKKLLFVVIGGFLLSSFWVIPFLLNMKYNSGSPIGVLFSTDDPLFILFPKINLFLNSPNANQLGGILLLICSFWGIVKLIKSKEYFLPATFLIVLIFLPREYLIQVVDLPLHYYRFISHIFVLNIFLAGFGLYSIFNLISKQKKMIKIPLKAFSSLIIILTFLSVSLIGFNLSSGYHFNLDDYSENKYALEITEYLDSQNVKGRVATIPKYSNQKNLGSPHFFASFIPLEYDIPTLPGLLAESAFSSEFIIPTIGMISNDALIWGNSGLMGDQTFKKQSLESTIKRLSLFNVEYLISSGPDEENALKKLGKNKIVLIKKSGPFALFRLRNNRPFLEEISVAPFLYVDKGGGEFREFSKEWYKQELSLDYPVIYSGKNIYELSSEERQKLKGFIVNYSDKLNLSYVDFAKWIKTGKDIVFLTSDKEKFKRVKFRNQLLIITNQKNIGRALFLAYGQKIKTNALQADSQSDQKLKFTSNKGVLINYSFFPKWKTSTENQTIFQATPAKMFVFGVGSNELFY